MSTEVAARTTMWRNLMWAGIAGSLVGWTWSWMLAGGVTVVMLVTAIAAAVLLLQAMRTGNRLAYVGIVAAGVVLLFGSVLFTALLFLGGGTVTMVNWVAESLIPMASAVALLLGAGPSLRHAQNGVRSAA